MRLGKYYRNRKLRSFIALVLSVLILLQTAGCSTAGRMLSQAESAVRSALPTKYDISNTASELFSFDSSNVSQSPSARIKDTVQNVRKIAQNSNDDSIPKQDVSKKLAAPGPYGYLSQKNDERELNTEEKSLYGKIGQSVYRVAGQKNSGGYYPAEKVSMSGSVPESQIRVALMAYLDDNPQVFWIANAYSYGYQGGKTMLQLYSRLSRSECDSAIRTLNGKIRSVIFQMPSGLKTFSREEFLFDYLTAHCTYSDAAAADESLWQAYTAYGALTDGKVVCEGYSRAMQLLSSYADLPCALIRGAGQGAPHMWNLIRINGIWTHLDVTWCDSDLVCYNYYNVTDSAIRQSHTIAPSVSRLSAEQVCTQGTEYNLFLPACSSDRENYFRVRGIPVQTLSGSGDSAVINALVPRLKAGETTLTFSIGEKLNFDRTINGLLTSSPYRMSVYLIKAAAKAGKKPNLNQVTYVTDAVDRGLTLHISYQ